jgi:hypothetical protein
LTERGGGDDRRDVSSLRTSVTKVHQDIGDSSGLFGGDTSPLYL